VALIWHSKKRTECRTKAALRAPTKGRKQTALAGTPFGALQPSTALLASRDLRLRLVVFLKADDLTLSRVDSSFGFVGLFFGLKRFSAGRTLLRPTRYCGLSTQQAIDGTYLCQSPLGWIPYRMAPCENRGAFQSPPTI
jgi:hypothetical protein